MANLPQDRVTPNNPPFTYVGVDCFGPFLIRSDNGGNFVKGEKELQNAIDGWIQEVIAEFLLQRN
ncbi:hypothetical protein P5673_006550, partial [Acropora cervicornis]